MHISKFLEMVNDADPRRSEYRIVLIDGEGKEVDSISDVSGVSYVTDLFLDLKGVVAGEKEIVDGIEDQESLSDDDVSKLANTIKTVVALPTDKELKKKQGGIAGFGGDELIKKVRAKRQEVISKLDEI